MNIGTIILIVVAAVIICLFAGLVLFLAGTIFIDTNSKTDKN